LSVLVVVHCCCSCNSGVISITDGPDYSPSPGNYRFSETSMRSCLEIIVRADTFYEEVETLTGSLVSLVNNMGAVVDSIRGVILSPDTTNILITDVDCKFSHSHWEGEGGGGEFRSFTPHFA
jgi:hypothetical protein